MGDVSHEPMSGTNVLGTPSADGNEAKRAGEQAPESKEVRRSGRSMKLREYKIRNLALLARLQEELPAKYGEEAREVVEKLTVKTHALRAFTLADYLTTILLLSRKYPELKALIPSVEEVDDLLKDQF